jgi:hypothetical protein
MACKTHVNVHTFDDLVTAIRVLLTSNTACALLVEKMRVIQCYLFTHKDIRAGQTTLGKVIKRDGMNIMAAIRSVIEQVALGSEQVRRRAWVDLHDALHMLELLHTNMTGSSVPPSVEEEPVASSAVPVPAAVPVSAPVLVDVPASVPVLVDVPASTPVPASAPASASTPVPASAPMPVIGSRKRRAVSSPYRHVSITAGSDTDDDEPPKRKNVRLRVYGRGRGGVRRGVSQ